MASSSSKASAKGGTTTTATATATMTTTPRCVLDENSCLSVANILESFNAPINEEHAWAVCYQCAKTLKIQLETDPPQNWHTLASVDQMLIHKDGNLRLRSTCGSTTRSTDSRDSRRLQRPLPQCKLVSSLGLLIYQALDYGLAQEEERHLSPALEQLIDAMTSTDSVSPEDSGSESTEEDSDRQETDEGIERDSGEDDEVGKGSNRISLHKVMELCANHLSVPGQADLHYKAVCRALVAEALELSTFLEKISQGKEELNQLRRNTPNDQESSSDLQKLNCYDWARLWVQVIRELRQGVKLKKVVIDHNTPSPIEFELTPYEILMDDIRSRRYKLNKIMVNGDIPPRVKKDAHHVILEFIRSRPPLHPVSQRKIRSPSLTLTPYEELMQSIRRQDHKLKHAVSPPGKTVETSRTKLDDNDSTPKPTRRLIKADLSLLLPDSFEEDDEEYLATTPLENGFDHKPMGRNGAAPSSPWQQAVALDLTTQGTVFKPERRHSITVCESPTNPQHPEVAEPVDHLQSYSLPPRLPHAPGHHRPNLFQPSQWSSSMECLSLTLEEVVHIRNVLTKAELEGLLVDKTLYDDVSKGKVCFTCKKTRFSFFGQWGQKCRLCKRNVCERCCAKMRIPTEHFASVPVYTLSPGSNGSNDDDESPRSGGSGWRLPDVSGLLTRRMSAGSAPSSPTLSSKQVHSPSSANCSPAGTPSGSSGRRRPLLRSRTLHRSDAGAEELRGALMAVCRDCRKVVRHAIVASRHSLNNKPRQHTGTPTTSAAGAASSNRKLHLNLSPIY